MRVLKKEEAKKIDIDFVYAEGNNIAIVSGNPMYYCINGCGVYLGLRGYCSTKCHNEYYDKNPNIKREN